MSLFASWLAAQNLSKVPFSCPRIPISYLIISSLLARDPIPLYVRLMDLYAPIKNKRAERLKMDIVPYCETNERPD